MKQDILAIKTSANLSRQQREHMTEAANALGESLGLKCVVLDGGMDAELHRNNDPLLTKILEATLQQTASINRLCELNEMLIAAMAEDEGMEDRIDMTYMDGTRIE